MSLDAAFHFLNGGPAAHQFIFDIGDGSTPFTTSYFHIHGFVLSNAGGAACTVSFTDDDNTEFMTFAVAADSSVIYEGVPFHIDNGLTITVTGVGAAIKWSVAYCGDLSSR